MNLLELLDLVAKWNRTRAAANAANQEDADRLGLDDAYGRACDALARMATRLVCCECREPAASGIFVRRQGGNLQICCACWDKLNPGKPTATTHRRAEAERLELLRCFHLGVS